MREVFDGAIAGVGTASGTRVVIGLWPRSPLGRLFDLMIERADGHRILIAPDQAAADFISSTYRFDEVRQEPTRLHIDGPDWRISSPSVDVRLRVGGRTALGWLLYGVPRTLARQPWWTALLDRAARVVLPGVRTVGSAGQGRREFYCALDLHRIDSASVTIDGLACGELRPVTPPVRFGFGSTPDRPSLVRIRTVVVGPGD